MQAACLPLSALITNIHLVLVGTMATDYMLIQQLFTVELLRTLIAVDLRSAQMLLDHVLSEASFAGHRFLAGLATDQNTEQKRKISI